jgi:hypothetical protein
LATVGVSDILRTETDPQSLGEIAYRTSLVSASATHRVGIAQVGAAIRRRGGTIDTDSRSAWGFDVGVVIPELPGIPVRIAASTFMAATATAEEAATLLGGIEGPIVRRDSSWGIRGGYSIAFTEGRETEHYTYGTGTLRWLDVQAGLARRVAYGTYVDAFRAGVTLRYARYSVGIAREDSGARFGASYQFLLSSVF